MFNIQNWYWIVCDKPNLVYSSRRAGYFPADDSEYTSWKNAGNIPTKIDTEANLIDVFEAQYPAGSPSITGQIKAQILALEATVTQRRVRDAILGTDGGWLANVEAQIAVLRGQLS